MLKIHQVLIIKFSLLFIGAFVIYSVIGYMSLHSIIVEENKERLRSSISLISAHIDDVKSLDKYSLEINKYTSLRVTMIDSNGNVIAESNTNKENMDNHLLREEIVESKKQDFSYAIRYSDTLNIDFLYVAKQIIYKNSYIYLRLATPLSKVMEAFYSLLIKLSIVFLILLSISYLIARNMSEKVIHDIKQIKDYLNEIAKKNYEAVLKIEYFHEFLEISLILKNIIKRLNKKNKKKK